MSEFATMPLISLDKIQVPADARETKPKSVKGLAQSIASEGLLQAIGVRPDPAADGQYILVFGRHWLEAHKLLKRASIEARVIELDESSALLATLAENLFRASLRGAAYHNGLAKWADEYKRLHPEAHGPRAGGKARGRQKQQAARQARENSSSAEDEPTIEPESHDHKPESDPQPFAQVAGDALGVSPRKINQDVKLAREFTEEEFTILKDWGATTATLKKIAALADPLQRRKAVALISSGIDHTLAIAAAGAPAGATLEADEQTDTPDYKPESAMTDDEWLETYYGDVLAKLKHQDTYRRDAISWRKSRDARETFRSHRLSGNDSL